MVVVFVEEEESKSNFVFWLWNVSYNTKMSVEYLLLVALVQEVCKIPVNPVQIIQSFDFSSEDGGRHTWVFRARKGAGILGLPRARKLILVLKK